uniref:Phospholipid phosphatase 2a n=1 Tax=Oncorhynchus mykiss TaxID=8022 RepID=A0A8K9X5Q3_ONCMY
MTELPVHKKNMLILVDVLCVFVAALPSAVLTLMFSPYQRGIYCDDESIRYPYRRDTISHRAMAAVTIPSSIVIITTGEAFLVYSKRLHSNSNFNQYMSALYKVVGTFLFGAAVSQSLTDLAKFTIGRPRPNFLSVCNPTVCSGYMLQLNCTGNPRNVTESRCVCLSVCLSVFLLLLCDAMSTCFSLCCRLSFYSGHSAFGMYSMLFLALYVQARMQGKWTRLVRPTVQFFLVAFALYVGYTRVSDYKHHWSDVLVGLLQGTLIAVLNVCYVSDFFKLRPPPRCPRSEAAEDEHLEAKPGLDPDTQLHNNHYNYATTSAQTQTNNDTTTTATTQQPLHNNHGNRGEVA